MPKVGETRLFQFIFISDKAFDRNRPCKLIRFSKPLNLYKMFGDLLGNMEEKQKAMREKLAQIVVEAEAGGGAVKITANAARELTNISIDKDALDLDDIEQLEDLLLVAVNRVLEKISAKEQEESQNMINDMLPPGMGDLSNLFG